ncbi:MAG: pyrroline-5-carboxylate reductase [Pseudomonadota bacterium]
MEPMKIAFIGGGNMARSLIGGLLDAGTAPVDIAVSDPQDAARQLLESQFGIATHADNATAIAGADVVVLAVKPQQMHNVVSALNGQFSHQLLVSIAAGVRMQDIAAWSGNPNAAVVRCMPNTPALVGCGATGLIANAQVNDAQRQQAESILKAVGICAWVDTEAQLDAITALSGSGPAYFFLMLESMISSAQNMGISADTAKAFAVQTALGAARMAGEVAETPAQLRRNVTSPAGTTEAAINSFNHENYSEIVDRAMQAAAFRANELADELGANHG